MWNPFSGFVETWRSLFNPSVRKAWHLNLDTCGMVADGHFLEASMVGTRALALNEALYAAPHPEIATALDNLAFALDGLGKGDQAKLLFERARAMYEACYGPVHPKVASILNSLGRIAREGGDLAKAKTLHERALAMNEALYGTEAMEVAISLRDLGDVAEESGDLETAKEHFERALALTERDYVEYGGDQSPFEAMCDRLDQVQQKLRDKKGAQAVTAHPDEPKDKEAEAKRVYEAQNLGRVEQKGTAQAYALH